MSTTLTAVDATAAEAMMPDVLQVDGRSVAFYGDAPGHAEQVVALCHPAPGSGIFKPPTPSACGGTAVIGVDRPGYGYSDPMPATSWATVWSAADDVAAVFSALGVRRASVVGWSAGGRVALAFAARHPQMAECVIVLGTPAPHEEVPWIPEERYEALLSLRGQPPELVHELVAAELEELAPADPRSEAALGLLGRSWADDAALDSGPLAARLAEMLEGAFRQGTVGLAQDIAGFTLQPWGFEWKEVEAPTLLVYGDSDPIAGVEHGSWWQEVLPDATLVTLPDAGHISIVTASDKVLGDTSTDVGRSR